MFDTLIISGKIVDGSGRPAFKADIALKGGKICAIGDLSEASAKETLNVKGLCVCPGFIDMHSHSDLSLMTYRRGESSLSQGITTEVIGNCGWSMAPVKDETKNSVLKGLMSRLVQSEAFETPDWSWHSFGEFTKVLEAGGIGVNVAPLVGQSLVRAHVVGTGNRLAAPGEIEAMKVLVRQAMEDGAWGMSTGRSYQPGCFAPTSEIIELAKTVASFDGIYATHMKDEGTGLFDAVQEVIDISEQAGIRAEISHHKAVGKKNAGKVHRTLEMIERARRKGLAITVDLYPYEFSQATALAAMLVRQGWKAIREIIETSLSVTETPSPVMIQKAMENDPGIVRKVKGLPEMAAVVEKQMDCVIVRAPSSPGCEGMLVGDAVAKSGKSALDFVADLIEKDGQEVWAARSIDTNDIRTVISAPFAMGGTDAFNVDRSISPVAMHPRHFGTFPRIVGRFVREEHLFSLEEAVRKCTAMPARVIGIGDRGLVEPGYCADLVVFDDSKIVDTATGPNPYRHPDGIEYVLVNGEVAMHGGNVRPVYAGRVLTKR